MSFQLRIGIGLVAVSALAALARIGLQGRSPLERDAKTESFAVAFDFAYERANRDASIRFPIPPADAHQRISQGSSGPGAEFGRRFEGDREMGQLALPDGPPVQGVSYSFLAQLQETVVPVPERWSPPSTWTEDLRPFLLPTARIQSDHAEIAALARRLGSGPGADAARLVRGFHAYAVGEVRYTSVPGFADALSALRDGRSDCGGKSRLFVALCRASGLPARMVTGVILEPGSKDTLHTWGEAWLDGRWVPACPTRDLLGRLPARYLVLGRDDARLFEAQGVGRFAWDVRVSGGPGPAVRTGTFLTLWGLVESSGLPEPLVRMLVLIPLGALLVAAARIFVGFEIYGTFLPVLAALAFRESGFWIGSALFFSVLAGGLLVRTLLDPMKLLMVARLSIVMTLSILLLVAVSMVGARLGSRQLEAATLLPIVILTMMVERFYVVQLERGRRAAILIALNTWLLTGVVFATLTWAPTQALFLSYPELLAAVVGLQVLAGRWTGLRLYELWKYRDVILAQQRLIREHAAV